MIHSSSRRPAGFNPRKARAGGVARRSAGAGFAAAARESRDGVHGRARGFVPRRGRCLRRDARRDQPAGGRCRKLARPAIVRTPCARRAPDAGRPALRRPDRAGVRDHRQCGRSVALAAYAATGRDERGAGALWLLERQHALESEAPALRIELGIDLRNVDIAGGEADLSIRYGRGNWRQLDTRAFMPERLYPVAHPRLAAQLTRHAAGAAMPRCSTSHCCTIPT